MNEYIYAMKDPETGERYTLNAGPFDTRRKRTMVQKINYRVTPEQVAKIVKMYREGVEALTICKECGISRTGLYIVLRSENVPKRKREYGAQG